MTGAVSYTRALRALIDWCGVYNGARRAQLVSAVREFTGPVGPLWELKLPYVKDVKAVRRKSVKSGKAVKR